VLKRLMLVLVLLWSGQVIAEHGCNCKGYAGPGGPCYSGLDGPAYDGSGDPDPDVSHQLTEMHRQDFDRVEVRADLLDQDDSR